MLNIYEGTSKSQLSKARKMLQEMIDHASKIKPVKSRKEYAGESISSDFTIKDGKLKNHGFSRFRNNYISIGIIGAAIQNYKNYFVPSFSLSVEGRWDKSKKESNIVSLKWEPNFIFAENDERKLKAHRNDFLTIAFRKDYEKDADNVAYYLPVSLSYLIKRSGSFFEKILLRLA